MLLVAFVIITEAEYCAKGFYFDLYSYSYVEDGNKGGDEYFFIISERYYFFIFAYYSYGCSSISEEDATL